ncbi:MAG TPA: stage II sporulation protein P [Clostridia bacterium]|nr:stage II sporulation protein P [Clostridia bacterium]
MKASAIYALIVVVSFAFLLRRDVVENLAGRFSICLVSILNETGGGHGLALWEAFEELEEEEAVLAFAPSAPDVRPGDRDRISYEEGLFEGGSYEGVIDPRNAVFWPGNRVRLSRWALESSIPGLAVWSENLIQDTGFEPGKDVLYWVVSALSGTKPYDPRSLLGLVLPVLEVSFAGARGGRQSPPDDINPPHTSGDALTDGGAFFEPGLINRYPYALPIFGKEQRTGQEEPSAGVTAGGIGWEVGTDRGSVNETSTSGESSVPNAAGAGPKEILVGIYHTHSRESFLPEISPRPSSFDDAHTSDQSKSVVRIGEEIASILNSRYRIGAVHSKVACDEEGKLGAYVKSLAVARDLLKRYPTIKMLIDVHRDALPRDATTIEVGGVKYARVMLVLGTDRRLPHPNWRKNFEVALKFVRNMETRQPGIIIGIYPKYDRYNQHLLPGAMLLEIGGVENTMDECLRTSHLVAEIIAGMIGRNEVQ